MVFQEICNDAGEAKIVKAKKYIKEGRVNIVKSDYENLDNFSLSSIVAGNYGEYNVDIDISKGELEVAYCECPDYQRSYCACKHIVATLMQFEHTKYWDNKHDDSLESTIIHKNNNFKYKTFNNLINSFYNEELRELNSDDNIILHPKDKIKIESKIIYDKFSTRYEIRV